MDKGKYADDARSGDFVADLGFTSGTMELVHLLPGAAMCGSGQKFTAYIFKRTPPTDAEGFASRAVFKTLPAGKATRHGTLYGLTATELAEQAAAGAAKKAAAAARREASKEQAGNKREVPAQRGDGPKRKGKKGRR